MATASETTIDAGSSAAHAESVVRRSGTSFYWAMRRLPAEKRNAMYAIYAFCREVDDIADDPGETEEKHHRLGLWRGEIERLYGDTPRLPVAQALMEPVNRFGLKKEDFRAVIDGMEMDAGDSVRIADMDELHLYCDRVACAVGRLSNRVFGVDEEKGDKVAFALGQALQLTNILRDVHEDAQRDRLYLPQDLLRAHGIDPADVKEVLAHPKLPDVCAVVADIALRRFGEADEVLAQCDRGQMRPAIMMMEVYRQILRRLLFRGWRRLHRPVTLSKLQKVWIAMRYGVL